MESAGKESLVRHAFSEQRTSQLAWYVKISTALRSTDVNETAPSSEIHKKLQKIFNEAWGQAVDDSPKLRFYKKCKTSSNEGIFFEPYLNIKSFTDRKHLTRLRSSSHRLKIETGRYQQLKTAISDTEKLCQRRCEFCTTSEIELLSTLPYAELPIIEDEHHVLISCPKYHSMRLKLDPSLKSLILRDEEHHQLFSPQYCRKMGHYIKNIFEVRFPRRKK